MQHLILKIKRIINKDKDIVSSVNPKLALCFCGSIAVTAVFVLGTFADYYSYVCTVKDILPYAEHHKSPKHKIFTAFFTFLLYHNIIKNDIGKITKHT